MVVSSDSALAPEDGILQWDKLQPPMSRAAVDPPPKTPWSMVTIGDDRNIIDSSAPVIFPPINHENLSISSDPPFFSRLTALIGEVDSPPTPPPYTLRNPHFRSDLDWNSDSDSVSITNSNASSAFSPSNRTSIVHFPALSSLEKRPPAAWFVRFVRFRSEVDGIIRGLWLRFASSRWMLANLPSFTITATLIAFLYFRNRRRMRADAASRDRLLGVIKEKDERIRQLLNQISRINQVLLASDGASSIIRSSS